MNFQRDTTSGQEGIDLIRQLHRSWPDLPVVLMTAWATVERAVEAMQLGARDYCASRGTTSGCSPPAARSWRCGAPLPDADDAPAGDELGRSPAMRAVMRMVRAIAQRSSVIDHG